MNELKRERAYEGISNALMGARCTNELSEPSVLRMGESHEQLLCRGVSCQFLHNPERLVMLSLYAPTRRPTPVPCSDRILHPHAAIDQPTLYPSTHPTRLPIHLLNPPHQPPPHTCIHHPAHPKRRHDPPHPCQRTDAPVPPYPREAVLEPQSSLPIKQVQPE